MMTEIGANKIKLLKKLASMKYGFRLSSNVTGGPFLESLDALMSALAT